MEESQFYDIRVPTTIDPNELGSNYFFPSLIQTKSSPEPSLSQPPKEQKVEKKEKKSPVILNEGDFPGLVQESAKK